MASRRVGYSRLLESKKRQQQFQSTGAEISQAALESTQDIYKDFKIYLCDFIKKHRKKINSNPAFRIEFLNICDSMGVDPLAYTSGIWSKTLNLSSFYSQLSVQILDYCIKTRDINGGICDVEQCLQSIQSNTPYSYKDLLRAVHHCSVFGKGLRCIQMGSRNLLVTTAITLSSDHQKCLDLAINLNRGITANDLVERLYFTLDKACNILRYYIRHQIAWIDVPSEYQDYTKDYNNIIHWFPALQISNV